MKVLFLVGPPGVGKTTLTRSMLSLGDATTTLVASPKWTLVPSACAAGHYTGGTFDGADTVPYNGVAASLSFWEQRLMREKEMTVLDGDRFSNLKVVEFFRERVEKVFCAHVTADQEVIDARRKQRGSNQNATWMKGRVTKSTNFAKLFPDDLRIDLDATKFPPERLANILRKCM